MKYQDERKSNAWILGVVAVLAISTIFSLNDFRYFAFARTVPAIVVDRSVQAAPTPVGAKRGTPRIVVEYRYKETKGEERQGRDEVPMGWEIPESGGTVPVEFLTGIEGSSRLSGHRNSLALAFWFGSLGSLGIIGFVLKREAQARERKRHRREQDEA